jgi:hypothetical protein
VSFIIQPAASAGATIEAIAKGTLPSGAPVVINTDGTVSATAPHTGTATVFNSAATDIVQAVYDANSQKVVICYRQTSASLFVAVVGTVSGTAISFGTPVSFGFFATIYLAATYDASAQKIVIVYSEGPSTNKAIVGTVSGTSISFGSAVSIVGPNIADLSATYDANAQKVVIAYRDVANSSYGTALVGTVSGTSISFGTPVVFESSFTNNPSATYDSNSQKIVIAYIKTFASGQAIVGTVSGTSISFGTAAVFSSSNLAYISAVYDANSQKIVIAYSDYAGLLYYGTAIVGTVSGTSISFGAAVVFQNTQTDYIAATYSGVSQNIVIAYRNAANSNYGTAITGTVSGTTISFGQAFVYESATTSFISTVYDVSSQKVVIAYRDTGNSSYGTAIVYDAAVTPLLSTTFIGFSSGAYSTGQTATINVISNTQSGLTLETGAPYYVLNNATISRFAGSPVVYAGVALSSTTLLIKG